MERMHVNPRLRMLGYNLEVVAKLTVIDELIDIFLYGNDELSCAYNQQTKEIITDIDDVTGDLVKIPQISSTECYDLMVTFSKGLDDDIEALLVEVLKGERPFGAFKDKVSEHGIEIKWYEFENNYAKIKMVEWLEEQA